MSYCSMEHEQDQNTAKLVMNTFYQIADKDGVSAGEITKYLQEKYGDVWRLTTLTVKAEETLKRSAILGFLDRRGDRYVANLARELRCGKRKRKRSRPRRRRRKRKSCSRRRRRRRKPSCCCR